MRKKWRSAAILVDLPLLSITRLNVVHVARRLFTVEGSVRRRTGVSIRRFTLLLTPEERIASSLAVKPAKILHFFLIRCAI